MASANRERDSNVRSKRRPHPWFALAPCSDPGPVRTFHLRRYERTLPGRVHLVLCTNRRSTLAAGLLRRQHIAVGCLGESRVLFQTQSLMKMAEGLLLRHKLDVIVVRIRDQLLDFRRC